MYAHVAGKESIKKIAPVPSYFPLSPLPVLPHLKSQIRFLPPAPHLGSLGRSANATRKSFQIKPKFVFILAALV